MKENKYDDDRFFEKYGQMTRSREGLPGAGEWPALKKLLPDLTGAHVLDLGCGYGWHCRYALEYGASYALGIDLSQKMLEKAAAMTSTPHIEYKRGAMEDIALVPKSFDVVISSLALHYVQGYDAVCRKVYGGLKSGGVFVLSVEHPVFTAQGPQDWAYGAAGEKLHWPVDRYFDEGVREAVFLGENVTKYHRTVAGYVRGLLSAGFALADLVEPMPDAAALADNPDMAEELRRPMMLILAGRK